MWSIPPSGALGETPVSALDIGDGGRLAAQEIPAAGVGAVGFGIFAEDLRRVAPGVDGDRNEGDPLTKIGRHMCLLVGQHRAGVGAERVHEGHGDDLAAKPGEREDQAVAQRLCTTQTDLTRTSASRC